MQCQEPIDVDADTGNLRGCRCENEVMTLVCEFVSLGGMASGGSGGMFAAALVACAGAMSFVFRSCWRKVLAVADAFGRRSENHVCNNSIIA